MEPYERMQTREIPLVPGAFGWALSLQHCRLPNGLPHRSMVKVIENRMGSTTIVVRDRVGNRFTLSRDSVIPRVRYFYSKDEKYHAEHSDRGQRILWEEIRFQEERLELQRKHIEDLYWRVRRSGNQEWIQRLDEHLAVNDPISGYEGTPPEPERNPSL